MDSSSPLPTYSDLDSDNQYEYQAISAELATFASIYVKDKFLVFVEIGWLILFIFSLQLLQKRFMVNLNYNKSFFHWKSHPINPPFMHVP